MTNQEIVNKINAMEKDIETSTEILKGGVSPVMTRIHTRLIDSFGKEILRLEEQYDENLYLEATK